MTFLRNAWYCSGWSHEISRQPMSRVILGEPVVIFRKEDGSPVALGDTCPHRFAPLHLGTLRGDAIECPYHGLQFGETGACILNPHSDTISRSLKVASYPIVERHRAIWLWMGDPAGADPALIPDYSQHDDPKFKTTFDRTPVAGSYQLVSDNLLDLTHVNYLHKTFQAPNAKALQIVDLIEDDQTITSVSNTLGADKGEMLNLMWPEGPELVDVYSTMQWEAPANLLLINCNTAAGAPRDQGILAYTCHLVTPETETSSHYFWSYSRNWRLDDDAFEQMLHQGLDQAIRGDDAAMIGHVQHNMGPTSDLMSLKPVILPTDTAAIRARVRVTRLLKAERDAVDRQERAGGYRTASRAAV